jgi:hypothetical protein
MASIFIEVMCLIITCIIYKVFNNSGKMKLALVCLLALFYTSQVRSVGICEKYPNPDPCLPGGVWDPVVQRQVEEWLL